MALGKQNLIAIADRLFVVCLLSVAGTSAFRDLTAVRKDVAEKAMKQVLLISSLFK